MARVTVEDCLRQENNRFSLVVLAARRAKQLLSGQHSVVESTGNKSVVTALREIAAGKVQFKTSYLAKGQPTPEDEESAD